MMYINVYKSSFSVVKPIIRVWCRHILGDLTAINYETQRNLVDARSQGLKPPSLVHVYGWRMLMRALWALSVLHQLQLYTAYACLCAVS